LGAPTNAERVQASHKLLDFGFNHYETHLLYRARVTTIKVPIWMGETSMLPLGLENNIYTTVPRGNFEKLAAKMSVGEIQYAPIRLGQKIGTLSIMFDKKTVEQYPLVALREVGVGNIYQRTIDRIKLWLK
jgi:D-alanyl-D-alanine carboxypeptidase (penicillin-binding protein 5/6)